MIQFFGGVRGMFFFTFCCRLSSHYVIPHVVVFAVARNLNVSVCFLRLFLFSGAGGLGESTA